MGYKRQHLLGKSCGQVCLILYAVIKTFKKLLENSHVYSTYFTHLQNIQKTTHRTGFLIKFIKKKKKKKKQSKYKINEKKKKKKKKK